MPGKRVQIDDETWQALDLLGRDTGKAFQELANEAFGDLLRKHDRPIGLKAALRRSAGASATITPLPGRTAANRNRPKEAVFPESMRGTGEGHYPWDLQPESTMTNATVASDVQSVDGRTLTLSYKDGEQKIVVPSGTPIVTFAVAERSEIKTGAAVFVPTQRQPDGTLQATRVLVGKGGVVPPM